MGRPRKITSYQEMLDEDVEEETRKKRLIDLGNETGVTLGVAIYSSVKPNFLGPTLTRRFRNSRIVRDRN